MIRRASRPPCAPRTLLLQARVARTAARALPRTCDTMRFCQPMSLLAIRRHYADSSSVHELEKYSTSVANLVRQRKVRSLNEQISCG